MIIFVYGTTAEAIKLAPISRRLRDAGIPQQHWLTFQHTDALRNLLPVLELPSPDQVIADGVNGSPLRSTKDVFRWLLTISKWTLNNTRSIRKTLPKNSIFIVHGDTMTSVVGAILSKFMSRPAAHVEAGLRSGNWRHPFPEELDRRIVGRLASIHYCPSPESFENLSSRSGKIFTHGNTVIDAVIDGQKSISPANTKKGVVLLHRYEFISNREFVEQTISTLASMSKVPLVFIVDAYSRAEIEESLTKQANSQHQLISKLSHQDFVELLGTAEFVVTDSGGIQEEAALIGVPTLIHRVATERQEGLGTNVLLSEWKLEIVKNFLDEYESLRVKQASPEYSPSKIIVDDLVRRGYSN